jgi:tetratricopeptide (TPR) repeat protein
MAITVYQECPLSPRVHSGMGDCYKTIKKFDLAVTSYSKAVQLVKKPLLNVDYRLNRAVCFYKLGKNEEALLDF